MGSCSLSQKELGPSDTPPVIWDVTKTTKTKAARESSSPRGRLRGASFGNVLIFLVWQELAFPAQQLCRPSPEEDPCVVPFILLVAAGSLSKA